MKKRVIFGSLLVALIMIGIVAVLVLKNMGWFDETVPYYGEIGGQFTRNIDDVYEETYSTGIERYIEGDYGMGAGTYIYLHEGMSADIDMNVKIEKGLFKVAIYDLGSDFKISDYDYNDNYLSENKKVSEQEFTESGTYKLDLSVLEPDKAYIIISLNPMGTGYAYSYDYTEKLFVKRWQYLYDSYIGSLPFCEPKYGGNIE